MLKDNNKVLRDEKGQTLVEYLLLTVLVVGLISAIYKSDAFQDYMGRDGEISRTLSNRLRFSYRHALSGKEPEKYPPDYTNPSNHKSYVQGVGATRFFGPAERYPDY